MRGLSILAISISTAVIMTTMHWHMLAMWSHTWAHRSSVMMGIARHMHGRDGSKHRNASRNVGRRDRHFTQWLLWLRGIEGHRSRHNGIRDRGDHVIHGHFTPWGRVRRHRRLHSWREHLYTLGLNRSRSYGVKERINERITQIIGTSVKKGKNKRKVIRIKKANTTYEQEQGLEEQGLHSLQLVEQAS